MRTRNLALLATVLLGVSSTAGAQQSSPPRPGPMPTTARVTGTWEGVLNTGGGRLRLVFVIRDSAGTLLGTMHSPDQGASVQAKASSVTLVADTLTFIIADQHISYSGALAAGDSLRGTFTQGGVSIPLVFAHVASPSTTRRPQDPVPPFPYRTRDVTIESAPGTVLAGTLVIPDGKGPFPAVVFVTGSGPQDRDETLVGHRPFLVIADYLARHGIASLRCDDRGYAKSTGSFDNATSADFAVDAEAAVEFLRHVDGVAADRVGILGHSEGGLIGPMVAARSKAVAFLVLMAGPGVPGDSISLLQSRLLAVAAGVSPAAADSSTANRRRLFEALAHSRDSSDAIARLAIAKQEILAGMPESQRAAAAARIDQNIPQLMTPWFRFFMTYDPRPALRKVRVPVLAMGGSLDLLVPPEPNLAAIDTALKAGRNRDYRVVELAKLNHLFQSATTGSPNEFPTIEETVSPATLELIATWINERFRVR